MVITFELDSPKYYNGHFLVTTLVDGVPVSKVGWVNGPPYLAWSVVESKNVRAETILDYQI